MNDTDTYVVVLEMYVKDDETKAIVGEKLASHFQEKAIIFSLQELEYKTEVTRFKVACCGLSQLEYQNFIAFVIENQWRPVTEWFAAQYRVPTKRGRKKKPKPNIVQFEPHRSTIPKDKLFARRNKNKEAPEKPTTDETKSQ